MYKRKLHKEISSGLLVLIVAFSLTGCGSSRDALEISDTESAQAEGISQETATATPATSQTIPETTTEPEPEKLTYQTGLYQEKTLADQVSVDAARELPEGEYGVLSYSYDETVSVWGNGAEDCLVIHDGDREYRVGIPWRNMYSAPPAIEAADYDAEAVEKRMKLKKTEVSMPEGMPHVCPGSMARSLKKKQEPPVQAEKKESLTKGDRDDGYF